MALTAQEKQIVEFGKKQGKSVQEIQKAIVNFRAGIRTPKPESQRVIDARQKAEMAEAEAQKAASPFGMAKEMVKTAGELTGITPTGRRIAAGVAPYVVPESELPDVVEELAGQTKAGSERKMGDTGKTLKEWGLPENLAEGVDIALDLPLVSLGLSKTIAGTLEKQAVRNLPELSKFLTKPLVEFVPDALKKVLEKDITEWATKPIKEGFENLESKFGKMRPWQILENVKNYVSRKGIPENFEQSVKRIATPEIEGTTMKDPMKLYDEFYDQELKFKKDIKQDTAIGVVGERIGDSYDKVVKLRQGVGKKMGEEVKKIGGIRTDVLESLTNFQKELTDNGMTIDPKTGIQLGKTSKVTSQDQKLLNEYLTELKKLGSNPSVAELDAFLSRVPKEIDVFKSANNVTQVTNGERIIKNHLRGLREMLSPTKNPKFADYYNAVKDYAALSDFLDEGAGFLGKKTASGDFAKDASLAKSSVQSILNQGKKDWLLKLEDLTGYQAMDESVIALKAMADAGNFRGKSLLDIISQESIPTSQKQILQRIIEKVADFAADRFIGSERDQTKRIIGQIVK